MKMKKKVISLIMLVALFAMQVMSVSAASKTTGMALTGSASPAYELREMNDSILAGIGNEDVAVILMPERRHWLILRRQHRTLQHS